jgi:molybdate transport system substrate-binding protein
LTIPLYTTEYSAIFRETPMRRMILTLLAGLLLAAAPVTVRAGDEPLTVLAAASLTDAMTAAGEAWAAEGHAMPRLAFAASSTLARQIEAGAPADIYASANVAWMDRLQARGLIEPATRVAPVRNALVLVAPEDSGIAPFGMTAASDLPALLPEKARLAVGDPAHVPAGIYARQALEALGWWDTLRDRLALADDVRAALALVASGESPLGIVYATDARVSAQVQTLAVFPESSHDEIAYPFAILKDRARPEARAFLAFLAGPQGRAIFARFGFATGPGS